MRNIKKLNIASNHTSLSISAAAILLMNDNNDLQIKRKDIANSLNVSEVTINKTYKEIKKYNAIIVDSNVTDKLAEIVEQNRYKISIPESLIARRKSVNKAIKNDDYKKPLRRMKRMLRTQVYILENCNELLKSVRSALDKCDRYKMDFVSDKHFSGPRGDASLSSLSELGAEKKIKNAG